MGYDVGKIKPMSSSQENSGEKKKVEKEKMWGNISYTKTIPWEETELGENENEPQSNPMKMLLD